MKASLQVKNGYYYTVINYTDETGKTKYKWIATGLKERGNKREANQMMKEALEQFQREYDEKIKYGFSLWFNDESKIYYGCGMLGQMFVLLDEEVISLISEDKNNKIELLKDILLRKDVQNGNL